LIHSVKNRSTPSGIFDVILITSNLASECGSDTQPSGKFAEVKNSRISDSAPVSALREQFISCCGLLKGSTIEVLD
jgi:hypothetical protein